MPPGSEYLFDLYEELSLRRRIDPERGELPFDWNDFAGWMQTMGRTPTRHDIRCLCRIDDGYFAAKQGKLGNLIGG